MKFSASARNWTVYRSWISRFFSAEMLKSRNPGLCTQTVAARRQQREGIFARLVGGAPFHHSRFLIRQIEGNSRQIGLGRVGDDSGQRPSRTLGKKAGAEGKQRNRQNDFHPCLPAC